MENNTIRNNGKIALFNELYYTDTVKELDSFVYGINV